MSHKKLSQGLSLLEKTKNLSWTQDINLSASEIVAEAGAIQLLKYSAASDIKKTNLPLLLLPSFINRHYILDLLPEKSIVQFFIKNGFDVYLLNWGEPNEEDKYTSFDTLMTVHLDFLFAKMKKIAHVQKFHIVGQCLGGNIGLIYSLMKPQDVASLSLLTTPIDFSEGGKLKDWACHETLDLEKFIEARGNAPWLWMQLGFLGLKPTSIVSKYKKFFSKMSDSKFKRNFLALETWSFDNISVRGKFFITLINEFYKKNAWLNEGLLVNNRRLFLCDLKTPVSVLSAEDDHIVPLASTLKKKQVPQAFDFKSWTTQGGHIGALISGYSQQKIWPELNSWILKYDQQDTNTHAHKLF